MSQPNPSTAPPLDPIPSITPLVIYVTPAPLVTTAPVGTPTPTVVPTPTIAPTSTATATPEPAVTVAPAPTDFGPGTHMVGIDIQPGTYRTRRPSAFCEWSRLKGTTGSEEDVIETDYVIGYGVIEISPSDLAFKSDGCGTWSADLSAVTRSRTRFGEGTYIVGVDIKPGSYEARGGEGCYWARLAGFSGHVAEIFDNDYFEYDKPANVEILESDVGFKSDGCGSWKPDR